MKLSTQYLLALMVAVAVVTSATMSSCTATPWRDLFQVTLEGRSDVESTAGSSGVENHHNIPRQYYDDWGTGSPPSAGSGGGGDDGTG
ncbi:hypothetical protein V2J09_010603 [Rumex salicifolius]